jgi:L-rhamnose-H+ transport protein
MTGFLGVLIIAAGSACAASFYVPIKKVRQWSWESYWIVQGIFSWIVAPVIFAWCTVPSLVAVFHDSPPIALFNAVLFGALWGIGGLTFGLSMRFLGIAMGQSVALGFCAAFGTLAAPIIEGQDLFSTHEGVMTLIGVTVCVAGIAIVGYAGALRSKAMSEADRKKAITEFALRKGLGLAVLAGIMSACFSIGLTGIPGVLDAGNKIREVALAQGTDPLFTSNPVYILVMSGGFVTNFMYCGYLNIRNGTVRDYLSVSGPVLRNNLLFCLIGGTLWYLQFFCFGMGLSKLPVGMLAFGWSILMALNILFSNLWGVFLKEWKGVGRRTALVLSAGLIVLILSTFVIKL